MKIGKVIADFLLAIPFLMVLSTVFVIDHRLANGVVSGKYFWFYLSMGLVSLTAPIAARMHQRNFRFSVFDLLVFAFVASIYLSALLINDASQNTTKLVLLALLTVWYVSLRLTAPVRNLSLLLIILTGLIEAVWGLRQLYGFIPSQHSLFKLTGSFFNPGPYAGYLAVVFPAALYFALKQSCVCIDFKYGVPRSWVTEAHGVFEFIRHHAVKILSIIVCIAILLVLPAAMSRASWLAVTAGSLLVLCGQYSGRFALLKKYCEKHKKKTILTGFLALIVLLAAFSGMYFLKKDSADGRTLMWKIALQAAKEHPLGVGLGNFSGAYGDAQAAYFASGKASAAEEYVAGSPEYGFNEYLQIAVESGVIALVLFLAIVFLSLRSFIIHRKWGVAGSMVSLLVFACFSYPFNVLPFLILFVFLLAMSGADRTQMTRMRRIETDNQLKSAFIRVIGVISVPFLCLSITVFCLYREYPVYQAYRKWNTGKMYYHAGLYNDIATDYNALYPLLNDQVQFLFEYAQSLSRTGLDGFQGMADSVRHDGLGKSNEVLQRAMQISCDPMLYNIMGKNHQALKEYNRAEACFLKASHITPGRLYPFYLLAKLYHEMGLQDKVEEMADVVETKEVKVHSRAVEEMRGEVGELRVKN